MGLQFADYAFLEALVDVDRDRLVTSFGIFAGDDGKLTMTELRKALRGALHMDFTLATPFWAAHFGSSGRVSAETLLQWKTALTQLMLKAKFLGAARRDDPNALHRISASSFADILLSRSYDTVPRHVRHNMLSLPHVIADSIAYEDYVKFQAFQNAINVRLLCRFVLCVGFRFCSRTARVIHRMCHLRW